MANDVHTDATARLALAAIVLIATVLFATRLDRVPIHLHHDEIYFGLIAHSVAATGADPNGRFLPVYFQMDQTFHWYPPLIIYLTAALLKIIPLSDIAVRLPNVLVGVVSVILMYYVARRMLRNHAWGLVAAAMLALTPVHFINSRIATTACIPSSSSSAGCWRSIATSKSPRRAGWCARQRCWASASTAISPRSS